MKDTERIKRIREASIAYEKFMTAIYGCDEWKNDPNAVDTPNRVAKMFVNELTSGLDEDNRPKITVFDNNDGYDGMVFQGGIEVKSMCSHHHMPFMGSAYVAYIPAEDGKIIGLSKLNRIVEYYSRRPQVQENLTKQIHDELDKLMSGNRGVAVMIEASHTCVSHRGIRQDSTMKTTKLSGMFFDNAVGTREEFFNYINRFNSTRTNQ